MMRKEYDQYLNLIKKYPTLPTVCFVEAEIVADDGCNRWAGSIGMAAIQEYIFMDLGNGNELITKDDTEELEEYIYCDLKMSEEKVQQYLKEIIWNKAIFLNVNMPVI